MAKLFKVGDVVEITKEASSTGMLDFTESNGYGVEEVFFDGLKWHIKLTNESDKTYWYFGDHFKLKEDTMESNENHFKVGQTVWDVVYGKGVVEDVDPPPLSYPVVVKFQDGHRSYTIDGKLDKEFARTLFFSEPKIIAETKPAFVPTLKEGDVVFACGSHAEVAGNMRHFVVSSETERSVFAGKDTGLLKTHWEFYKLGEKIEFN